MAASASSGSVAYKFTADVYGFGADETTSPYRFTARRVDEETGNYYYRNCYYHTSTGRFMSNDPIGYADGLNMYTYAYNDPVNFRDPMGLCGSRIPGHNAVNCSVLGNSKNGEVPADGAGRVHYTDSCTVFRCENTPTDTGGLLTLFPNQPLGTSLTVFGSRPDVLQTTDRLTEMEDAVIAPSAIAEDNTLCVIGNEIAKIADKFADFSFKVTVVGGAITGAGIISGNPVVFAAGGATIKTGGVLGLVAGTLQFTAGLFQGIGSGDFRNVYASAASLGTGALISRGLAATIPRGTGALSIGFTKSDVAKAVNNNSIVGNVASTLIETADFLSIKQANCGAN